MNFLADDVIPRLLEEARLYFLIFGVILVVGGIMGYVKARSVPSLIAGGISGLLLILSGTLSVSGWHTWIVVDLLVCLLLVGRFLPALLKRKFNPAGYVVPLAIVGMIVAIVVLAAPIHL